MQAHSSAIWRQERPCIKAKKPPTGKWRNGLRNRLKSDRARALVGSNPTFPIAFLDYGARTYRPKEIAQHIRKVIHGEYELR